MPAFPNLATVGNPNIGSFASHNQAVVYLTVYYPSPKSLENSLPSSNFHLHIVSSL
jgi:hypothetical protein